MGDPIYSSNEMYLEGLGAWLHQLFGRGPPWCGQCPKEPSKSLLLSQSYCVTRYCMLGNVIAQSCLLMYSYDGGSY